MIYKIGETLNGMIKWECSNCGSVFTTRKRKPKTYISNGCKFCWVKV